LIAESEGKAVGYAVFFTSYSTWLGRNGIYMEDLYVSPDYRGQGAGIALLKTSRNVQCSASAAALNGVFWTGTSPPLISI
jgi:GNAT superfamily N-acetyltransferase